VIAHEKPPRHFRMNFMDVKKPFFGVLSHRPKFEFLALTKRHVS